MTNEYAILYTEINLLSLILIWVILIKTRGLSKMVAQLNFVLSIVSEMIFFVSDTIFVLINSGTVPGGNIAKLVCKELYFFSTATMCFFWFLYFEHMQDTTFVKAKRRVRIASSLIWITAALLIVNIFNGMLFFVDDSGLYHRGPLFITMYILPYTYVVFTIIRVIYIAKRSERAGSLRTVLLPALILTAPGIAGLIQFVYPRLPVACGVLALVTLILYLNWVDQLISLDPLTGLNNRKQLDHFYDMWSKSHNENDRLYLLLIDANKFKQINDSYGHVQGDKALKNIAEALKSGCKILPKRANIARYGGDEFAILFEADDPGDATALKDNINEKLKSINEFTKVPFELTVSIGIANSDGKGTLKALVDAADAQMYNEKRSR